MIKFLGIDNKIKYVLLMFFVIVISSTFVSAVRISEVELNPAGTDSGNEWVELYSSSEIDVSGWTLVNSKGKIFELNGSFEGYKVVATPYNFLTNDKQKLVLYDDSEKIVDETEVMSDSANDERSWQFCDSWEFLDSTREEKNNCVEVQEEPETIEEEQEEKIQEEEKVIENEQKEIIENKITRNAVSGVSEFIQEEVIELKIEEKGIKTWKSKKEYIREYALIGFALFCLLVLVYLVKYGRKDTGSDDF
ncbi:MAG: lamin tail domain-containing protein [Nanoarchaeota archaeon]|nr:lamin tail domain-containing protein [Nanoarchaeota archaeon]MBU4086200.1 lamin tail domain-containing protein [Nanoarchaeota archaeon]